MARTNELTNLYTLIIKSNQDFEIRVNGQVAKTGNLYKNQKLFNPPFEPPKEIPDVDDKNLMIGMIEHIFPILMLKNQKIMN